MQFEKKQIVPHVSTDLPEDGSGDMAKVLVFTPSICCTWPFFDGSHIP